MKDENVELVENSRYIVLGFLRETSILMEEEEQENGKDSNRYNKLRATYESLQYTQELLADKIRELIS